MRTGHLSMLFATALLGSPVRSQVSGAEPILGEVAWDAIDADGMGWEVFLGGLEEAIDVGVLRLVDAQSGRQCGSFYIGEPPTLRVAVASPGSPGSVLRLYVDVAQGSPSDPALLVRQPDGSWRCNDDARVPGYAGIMPVIDLEPAMAGDYEVWVGSYLRELGAPAVLFVTTSQEHHPGAGGQGWRGGQREATGEGTGFGDEPAAE